MQRITQFIIFAFTFLGLISSCEKDYSFCGDANSIAFSVDTLLFDTIFAGEATATTSIRIYNRSGKDMTIERIYLKGGDKSSYNININGFTTTELTDIRIQKGDSLYVFLNILPPITSDKQPYLIEDEIIVESGANNWHSTLLAYAQNVIRIKSAKINDEEWSEGIPYLLSGTSIVDSISTLKITQGAQIYLTEGASINVYGGLEITGTQNSPVQIKGARLEQFYDDIPGQWSSITLMPSSKPSIIEYATIANATYGIIADSSSEVQIRNVIIRDCSQNAIFAYGAKTKINNSLLYNSKKALVAIYGGDCTIIHTTMSNYYRWEARNEATLYVNGESKWPELNNLLVANSIIVGNLTTELTLDTVSNNKALLTNNFIRLGKKWDLNADERFINIINDTDPQFIDRDNFDFHLDSTSTAINAGLREYSETLPFDLDGISRLNDIVPDLGCYELNLNSK